MNRSSDRNGNDNPVIKLPQGMIEGFVLRSRLGSQYFGFYGIPYANVPERFEMPQRWSSWNGGVRDGTRALDRCLQISKVTKRFLGSENCLYLNVFSPKFKLVDKDEVRNHPPSEPPEKFPVMVFIHGGGFNAGGGDLYGNKFLVDQGVILITLNYRLGVLGFLNTGEGTVPGNLALHDQVMSLRWVQENVGYFGGDKDNVTLVGESAGAACVHLHMLSPLSSGLFSKAIMQSGTALAPWAFNQTPTDKLNKLLKQLDLNGGFHQHNMAEVLTKLRKLDAEALVAQRLDYHVWKEDAPVIHFAPSIESIPKTGRHYRQSSGHIHVPFLSDSPLKLLYTRKLANEVPVILGVNAHEALYRSLPILKDSAKVKALNDHWGQELPFHLMYKKEGLPHHDDFTKRIRQFYFDSKPILFPQSVDARERLTNMISDRLFNYPTRKTALLHRGLLQDPKNKIYLYYFDYTGHYSYANGFEVSDTFGVAHADELQYLMNQRIFYSKITAGSEADQIIDKMTAMWGNFAKTGKPSYHRMVEPWSPIPAKEEIEDDALKYFRIGVEDKMILEPFMERMLFWDFVPNLSLIF